MGAFVHDRKVYSMLLGLLAIWGAIVGTLGLLMAFARTSPDEAYSNLSQWLGVVRFHRAQQWLRDRAVDRFVLRYGQWLMVLLLFLGGMIFQAWLSQKSNQEQWAALTKEETAALQTRVKLIPPEDIVVGCETVNCKDLTDGIADILRNTPGWKVTIHHGGGFDITGFTGIILLPKETATEQLKDAIETTTNLKVTMPDETRAQEGTSQSFLTVGIKPF